MILFFSLFILLPGVGHPLDYQNGCLIIFLFLACFLYTSLCEFRIRSIEKVHKFWLMKLTCTWYISPNTDNLQSLFILFLFF